MAINLIFYILIVKVSFMLTITHIDLNDVIDFLVASPTLPFALIVFLAVAVSAKIAVLAWQEDNVSCFS